MTELMDPFTDEPFETPCRLDPGAWYPEGSHGSYDTARKWCQRCPMTAACLRAALDLEAGLDQKFRHGMWGGKTPPERAQIERAERRATRSQPRLPEQREEER